MSSSEVTALTIALDDAQAVSGLLCAPKNALACYVFAHGAGAGMNHAFMAAMANDLASRAIATLRYQFPYMEQGSKRPDSPRVAHSAVRAAVAKAAQVMPDTPLFAGGKSFGGRMTSQAQAASPLLGIQGLVFIGFPLHPAGKPSVERAKHLAEVDCPMLFLQGTRDELADLALLTSVLAPLDKQATLQTFEDADHSFHVRARSGQTDEQVRGAIADKMASWFAQVTHE
jgi:predicted alpha/beta-hydrolase family hydrolase